MTLNIFGRFAAVAAFGLCATAASAATIVNGSFEDPDINTTFETYFSGAIGPNGADGITGWTVESGSVDLVDTSWIAQDGDQAIDLDGSAVGSISQDITGLVIGTEYTISFYMSGNNVGGPVVKTMDLSVGGALGGFSFDTAGGAAVTGDWELKTFDFTATAMTEKMTFQSTTGGSLFGPAIDNVSISGGMSPVPLPAGGVLLITGLGALGLMRRRRL